MTPFEAYKYYMAVKLHFTSSYDCVKYNYKVSIKESTFDQRRDKYFFAKLTKIFKTKEDIVLFYVSQFLENDKPFIGNMLQNMDAFKVLKGRHESIRYNFINDIRILHDIYEHFDNLFMGDRMPNIIEDYLNSVINIESVVILNRLTNFLNDVKVNDILLFPDIKHKLLKYQSFVDYDEEKSKDCVLKVFTS